MTLNTCASMKLEVHFQRKQVSPGPEGNVHSWGGSEPAVRNNCRVCQDCPWAAAEHCSALPALQVDVAAWCVPCSVSHHELGLGETPLWHISTPRSFSTIACAVSVAPSCRAEWQEGSSAGHCSRVRVPFPAAQRSGGGRGWGVRGWGWSQLLQQQRGHGVWRGGAGGRGSRVRGSRVRGSTLRSALAHAG